MCESHGVPESEVPEDVIKLIQSYKIGAFLAEEDAVPLVVETSSSIQPAASPLILPGIAGAASAETFKTGARPNASPLLAPNLSGVPEGGRDAGSSNVIAALVGTRSVSNVIKTLQQVSLVYFKSYLFGKRQRFCYEIMLYNKRFDLHYSNLIRPKPWIAVIFL